MSDPTPAPAPAPLPSFDPLPPDPPQTKNVAQSVTMWGVLPLVFPLIQQASTWNTMTPDQRTQFLVAAFGVVMVIYGRLRKGDLHLFAKSDYVG